MLKSIKKNYKNAVVILISLILGLMESIILSSSTSNAIEIQNGISKEIIRLHIIANSDTEEDQALKLKIKNEVVLKMKDLLSEAVNINDTREIINENLDLLNNMAQQLVLENGYEYKVSAFLTECYFPIREYGDIVLPQGEYETLKIEIGEAKGKNWWCIMFPPLCFIDSTHGVVNDDSKKMLQSILTEEEYFSITKVDDIPIKVKLKIIKIIKEYFK